MDLGYQRVLAALTHISSFILAAGKLLKDLDLSI